MKKNKICLVATEKTIKELLKNFEKLQEISDFIEIRLDYIKNISLTMLIKIFEIKKSNTKVIITCRSKKHGGEFQGSIEEQEKILQMANDIGFEYLDIDIKLIDKIKIKNKKSKIICSYHNFNHTPTYEELSKIIDYMREFVQTDICKTATMVNDKKDNEIIFKIIEDKKKIGNVIILGMGEKGKETRIKGLLIGNYLTFASYGNNLSAPGQIDIEIIKNMLKK